MSCFCKFRGGAHEWDCSSVGEFEYVHCKDCDKAVWMASMAIGRCQECRIKFENSPEYKEALRRAQQEFIATWKRKPPDGK